MSFRFIDRLAMCFKSGTGTPMTSSETHRVHRALEVLRRVAHGECTNAQREAADLYREFSEER